MTPLRILVSSPDPEIGIFLKARLSPSRYKVITCQAGANFVEIAQQERPEIVVLEWDGAPVETVLMEIALLKSIRPEVRLIALSRESSMEDIQIVEHGVFYYLTREWRPVIVDIIQAAVQSYQSLVADHER